MRVVPERAQVAAAKLDIADEGQGRAQHEDDTGILRTRREAREGAVMRAEAARRDRRHRVADRVERAHARGGIADRAGQRQRDIDPEQRARDVMGARHDLAQRVESFGLKIAHPADAQHRQEDHRDEGDPEPAEPVQHTAPQHHAARQRVEMFEDGVAGGGDARGGLEIGVGPCRVRRALDEGEGREDRQAEPDRRREQISLPRVEPVRAFGSGRERENHPDQRGLDRRLEEFLPVRIEIAEVHCRRDQHCCPEDCEDQAEEMQDGPDIGHVKAVPARTKCWR